ncbi:MAG: DegT/DnrJ/EryC1/StrS family aminotransferase [Burkholderiaceae bacterium]
MWKVQLFKLNYDDREIKAAAGVVESGWLTMGEKVIEFEQAFARLLGGGDVQCLAVTNCTAALHMAVLAAGVGPGDEVIIPALTFVADANVVRMAGAAPVLADCTSEDDLTMSAADIARKITPRTKAVIVTHYGGFACDMAGIVELCRQRDIVLIEDCAHTPGGEYAGRALGTFGDIGCFSFFSNKNLSIGEGGMLSFRKPEIGQQLRYLRSHGMTTLTLDRHKGRAYTYDVAQPGLNYRMDEIHAALGLVQLDKLLVANARRGELTKLYRRLLSGGPVRMPFANTGDTLPTWHILPVLLPADADRQATMARLKDLGIQSSIHYPPFWGFEAYSRFKPEDTPVCAALIGRELTLPLYPTMTDDEVRLVVDSLHQALAA